MKNKRESDTYYLYLREKYLRASLMIFMRSVRQCEDRKILKITTDPIEKKAIRHRLAERRGGPEGLRALNKDIRRFYEYCYDKGY